MEKEDCPVFSPLSKDVLFCIDELTELDGVSPNISSYVGYFEACRSSLKHKFSSEPNFERRKSCSAVETSKGSYDDISSPTTTNNNFNLSTHSQRIDTCTNTNINSYDGGGKIDQQKVKSFPSNLSNLKKTIALNNLANNTSLEVADIATLNHMELCTIDDLDTSEIPGYVAIPQNIPHWKKEHFERKNKAAINEYLKQKSEKEVEERKFGDIPQWKKNLLLKKEQQQLEQKKSMEKEENKFGDIPQWKKDLLIKKCKPNKNH